MRNQEGKFLLIHTTKEGRNRWEFPGGKVDSEELSPVAAERECLEETGISVLYSEYLCTRQLTIDGDDWEIKFFIANTYTGSPTNREPDKADEVCFKSWGEIDNLPQIPLLCTRIVEFLLKG